jgi:hypothetical protein
VEAYGSRMGASIAAWLGGSSGGNGGAISRGDGGGGAAKGAFVDSCHRHCGCSTGIVADGSQDENPKQAFARWYTSLSLSLSPSLSLSLSPDSLDAKVGATTKTAMTAAAAASAAASRLATPVGQERQQHEEEEGPQQQQQQRLWTQSGSYPCTSCCASAARPLGPGVAYVNDSRPGCGGALDDSGCSYNGEAQPDGSCVCLPQWKGPHCAQLNLMPTPRDAVRADTTDKPPQPPMHATYARSQCTHALTQSPAHSYIHTRTCIER